MRLWPLIFNHLPVETAGSRRALEFGNRGMRRVKTAVGTTRHDRSGGLAQIQPSSVRLGKGVALWGPSLTSGI